MGDMLSQAEIDALLGGPKADANNGDDLTTEEIDALGEIGNISMGSAATALFTLVGHKVSITTPNVLVTTLDDIAKEYNNDYVGIKIEYTQGLKGSNFLLLKNDVVKIITNLMMGNDVSDISGELTDFHLSAIGEAMNQMMGSACTSMANMMSKVVNMSTPKAFPANFNSEDWGEDIANGEKIVKISFQMEIEDIFTGEIMQIIPLNFAKKLVEDLQGGNGPVQAAPQESVKQPQSAVNNQNAVQANQQVAATNVQAQPEQQSRSNVAPLQFESFTQNSMSFEKDSIELLMDVPLQITVELGRTQKHIKDILEFGQGSIIELDKLAGEHVDILVNGKIIAKGEVVIIDENFGVRITDIVHPNRRV